MVCCRLYSFSRSERSSWRSLLLKTGTLEHPDPTPVVDGGEYKDTRQNLPSLAIIAKPLFILTKLLPQRQMKRDKSKFDRLPKEEKKSQRGGKTGTRFGPPEPEPAPAPAEAKVPAPLNDAFAGAKEKFILEVCTTLLFIGLFGDKREVKLTKRIMSYKELQNDIARYNKKGIKAYVIHDEDGDVIPDSPFLSYDLIRIKEIGYKPSPKALLELGSYWEDEVYYISNPDSKLRDGRPLDKTNKKDKVIVHDKDPLDENDDDDDEGW